MTEFFAVTLPYDPDPSTPKPPLMVPTLVLGELRGQEVTKSGATCDGDTIRIDITGPRPRMKVHIVRGSSGAAALDASR